MSVSLVLIVIMAVLYACGVYLMLERSITRVLLGFLLVGNATNLLILTMVGVPGEAPIVEDGVTAVEMTDPLPQALILTAIVITFAVSAFLMALIYRSWRLAREDTVVDDPDDIAMREASAVPSDPAADDPGDSEFGVHGDAPVSGARDLELADELAAHEEFNSTPTTEREENR